MNDGNSSDNTSKLSKITVFSKYEQVAEKIRGWLKAQTFNSGSTGVFGFGSPESTQPEIYTETGGRPAIYSENSSDQIIDREEARLIARAKHEKFLLNDEFLRIFTESAIAVSVTGSEHDVYFLFDDDGSGYVIRSTIKDSYGFRHKSPAQYLARLQEYNSVFPETQIRMVGVSLNKRGNGVIWTIQPFVRGVECTDESSLQKLLETKGWRRVGSDTDYVRDADGVKISDVHTGNVLIKNGKPYFVDVIVTDRGNHPLQT